VAVGEVVDVEVEVVVAEKEEAMAGWVLAGLHAGPGVEHRLDALVVDLRGRAVRKIAEVMGGGAASPRS
jgi:hypothetical protein